MNYLKTLFVAATCTAISFGSFSQTNSNDTDCSSARWISVKNSEKNEALFETLPEIFKEIKRQNDLKLLYATREFQEVGPLVNESGNPIIQTSDNGDQLFVYQDKTITTVQNNVPLVDSDGNFIVRTLDDGSQSYVFEKPVITSLHADIPLKDKNGNVLIETKEDGTKMFVFPQQVNFTVQPQMPAIDENGNIVPSPTGNPVNYSLSEQAISELHIVEAKSYDAETGEYSDDFHITRIAFCMNPSPTQQERLWVDLLSFFENMENPETNPFYVQLTERGYAGFQYKQTPCK